MCVQLYIHMFNYTQITILTIYPTPGLEKG